MERTVAGKSSWVEIGDKVCISVFWRAARRGFGAYMAPGWWYNGKGCDVWLKYGTWQWKRKIIMTPSNHTQSVTVTPVPPQNRPRPVPDNASPFTHAPNPHCLCLGKNTACFPASCLSEVTEQPNRGTSPCRKKVAVDSGQQELL